ncbi:MAG: hypothetical protein IJ705_08860 [Oscillospiraceae bacterium]|nr:hypothetical protein [Oscillospiraceae bacterium]
MMNHKTGRELLSEDALEQVTGGAAGASVASGCFVSNTGTQLNLLVSWSASDLGEGMRRLEVTVSTTSYSLNVDGRENGVELTVNGTLYLANSATVNYQGSGIASSTLASFALNVPAGAASISAVWHFKGSYNGQMMETITASGIANV